MRLIQATCTIIYTGRCDTYLPEADRLIIIKDDCSIAVHVDSGFKPLNYMKASKEIMMVEKSDGVYLKASNSKESLLIQMLDIKADIFLDFPDSERDMVKTGTEDNLQAYISENMAALIPGYVPVCREFETGKGPVDVLGMTEAGDGVALIEVKRHAHRKDVYQVVKYANGLDEMVEEAYAEGIERIEAKHKGDADGTGTMIDVDAIANHSMFLAARVFSRGTHEEAEAHGVSIVQVPGDYEKLETTISEMESFDEAAGTIPADDVQTSALTATEEVGRQEAESGIMADILELDALAAELLDGDDTIAEDAPAIEGRGAIAAENAVDAEAIAEDGPAEARLDVFEEMLPAPEPPKPVPAPAPKPRRRAAGKGEETSLFLSIKPVYGEKILSGDKTVEYRRKKPTRDCKKIYLYESKPVGAVVGECGIVAVETMSVDDAWEQTGYAGGIDEAAFREYFEGQDECVCFFLEDPIRYDVPLSFEDFGLSRAPLSFGYVNGDLPAPASDRFESSLFG